MQLHTHSFDLSIYCVYCMYCIYCMYLHTLKYLYTYVGKYVLYIISPKITEHWSMVTHATALLQTTGCSAKVQQLFPIRLYRKHWLLRAGGCLVCQGHCRDRGLPCTYVYTNSLPDSKMISWIQCGRVFKVTEWLGMGIVTYILDH